MLMGKAMADLPVAEGASVLAVIVALGGHIWNWMGAWSRSESTRAADHKDLERLAGEIAQTRAAFNKHEVECSAFRGSVVSDITAIKESSRETAQAVASLTRRPFTA
jgi:hypothetical protein